MSLTNKIENRILIIGTAVVTVAATVLIMNLAVIKPMKNQYEKQFKRQNEMIVELAKISKYSIQNTYTITKPKKGSNIIIQPNNSLDVQAEEIANNIDEKIEALLQPEPVKQNLWQRIFGKKKK
jgi:GGDEF domain-containing protein